MARKLTPEAERLVLEKAALGLSSRQIAADLGAQLGIKVSFQAIAKQLDKTKVERAAQAKAIVREKLSRTLCPDLDALAHQADKVRRLCNRLYKTAKTGDLDAARVFFAGVEQLRKVVDTTLHYSGADEPDGSSELSQAAERVARLLGETDAASDEAGIPPEDSADQDGASGS